MKTVLMMLALFAGGQAIAAADTPAAAPQRTLVYSFQYESNGDLESHGSNGYASDTHSGSGSMRDYRGSVNDLGTITVQVMREQPDKGLIVNISEQAEQTRKADWATCVVYGNTTIICDPNKTVNSEELTLLRFLGTTFVDPNAIDAKSHWAIDTSNAYTTTKADYTIVGNKDGVMSIDEARTIKQSGGNTESDVNAKIVYDFPKLVPTSISEYATMRQQQPGTDLMTTTVQTDLKLVSDSLASAEKSP